MFILYPTFALRQDRAGEKGLPNSWVGCMDRDLEFDGLRVRIPAQMGVTADAKALSKEPNRCHTSRRLTSETYQKKRDLANAMSLTEDKACLPPAHPAETPRS
jgi:hypothetical protein